MKYDIWHNLNFDEVLTTVHNTHVNEDVSCYFLEHFWTYIFY